jgi:hypothetical protein
LNPDNVVGVDRERNVLLARNDPDLVLGQEAPGLAAEEVKSPGGVVVGEIRMAQARSPAVALVVIRRGADAEEVALVIPAELLVRVDVALDEQRDSALPRASMKFVLVVER